MSPEPSLLSVFMENMQRMAAADNDWSSYWSSELSKFENQLLRDGYKYEKGSIHLISVGIPRLADVGEIATRIRAHVIEDQIARIEASLDHDPALAIGTAKELVESCFKTILNERGVVFDKEALPKLGKLVFSELKLLPDDVSETAKGSRSIRVLLSNLATIVQGLSEVRSLYGTGHGKAGRVRGVTPRHARLAVGAASTLVTFVYETHLETSKS